MLTPKEAATYKEEKWEELKPTYDDGIDFRNLQVELVKPDQYAILPVAEEWDCNSTGYRIVIAEDAASAKIKSEALKKDFITTKFSDIKR